LLDAKKQCKTCSFTQLKRFQMTTRRTFIIHAAVGSATAAVGILAANQALAQAPAVAETETQAASLGYKVNATKVDKAKFPKYAAGQNCKSCQLYQGKPDDKMGGCPLFAGKQVAATAWCSAWVKKAA
jgi:High potential iron-sulfur protein